MIKPEIIVTINSVNLDPDIVKKFSGSGATIFRLNGAFLDLDTFPDTISIIRNSIETNGKILLDLPGFKIRFLYLPSSMEFSENSELYFKKEYFNHPDFINAIKPGTVLRINDGTNELVCEEVDEEGIVCSASSSGIIKKGKGLHIDNSSFRMTEYSLTELDKNLIDAAKTNDLDYVGLSFVNDLEDIHHVEKLISGTRVRCLPKIESKESINNIHEILSGSEIVIVDRGDLAGEIGIEKVWEAQRDIIAMAKLHKTKVIIATQFLTNMIRNPVPSIAEIDSLYSLIQFGIDGVQLSDETCTGDYPMHALNIVNESFEKLNINNREQLHGSKGQVLWIMGPTASGKTTISEILADVIKKCNIAVAHYDGDEMRNLMGEHHSFSVKDRLTVVKSLVHVANKSASKGFNVIVSALTASDEAREFVRTHIENVKIIYLECDLNECIKRDPRGLYKKAINGEIDTLIGYNTPYIPPSDCDLKIDSGKLEPIESADEIVNYCLNNDLLTLW
jgi:pyruvate kinase